LIAAGSVAIWMLHPLQTQSVTYISQRTESLMGMFYIFTLYCFTRSVEVPRRLWTFMAAGACALGMATKEGMVTAPVAALLIDRWFIAGSFAEAWRLRRGFYLGLAAAWLLLPWLLSGLSGRGVGFASGLPPWDYALMQCTAVTRYFTLAFWPSGLVFDYGTQVGTPAPHEIALIIVLIVVAAHGLVRRTLLGFGICWFLLTLAPTSSFVPIPLQPISENRAYLPLAGLVVLVVLALERLGTRTLTFVSCGVAITLGGLTYARNNVYRDEVALLYDTVEKVPKNSRAWNNLGLALRRAGRTTEAVEKYSAALKVNPNLVEAHLNLSELLGHLGQYSQALLHAQSSVRLEPNNPKAWVNIGVTQLNLGKFSEAEQSLKHALGLRPSFPEAYASLALVYVRQGRAKEAIVSAEMAFRGKSAPADAYVAMGYASWSLGDTVAALRHFEALLEVHPDFAEGDFLCGTALLIAGRPSDAIPRLQNAVRSNPGHATAQLNLGIALARMERLSEARAALEAALKADPMLVNARLALDGIASGRKL
ncbi:MAG: tetratricopeptide repeat protein, partial [Opitutaceae bacterium]